MNQYPQPLVTTKQATKKHFTFNYNRRNANERIVRLLDECERLFHVFEECLSEDPISTDALNNCARNLNATIRQLMNSTNDLFRDEALPFIVALVKSAPVFFEKYDEAASRAEFGASLKKNLSEAYRSYFDAQFTNHEHRKCDKRFAADLWWNMQLFEWLDKEGRIPRISPYSRYSNKADQHYSDEELEKFFSENRTSILNKIQTYSDGSLYVSFPNPLDDPKNNAYFDCYVILNSLHIAL